MRRTFDTTYTPFSEGAMCGADLLMCPKPHVDTPHYCEVCQRYSDQTPCHWCFCTSCHIAREYWREAQRRHGPFQLELDL